jgi:DNA-binding transcriptional MerR regulator
MTSGIHKKSSGAFKTIGEVAAELGVQQHVLRFWESKFSQIKPLKRGGGRRYYRPEDIDVLKTIHHLLYDEGYTIKGVQKLFREQGKADIVEQNSVSLIADTVGKLTEEQASGLRAVLSDLYRLKDTVSRFNQ